jgi:hypothetical protein
MQCPWPLAQNLFAYRVVISYTYAELGSVATLGSQSSEELHNASLAKLGAAVGPRV